MADGERSPSLVEQAIMVVSVIFTVLLFAFVTVQAVTTPVESAPEVTVVDTGTSDNGEVLVTVRFRNPAAVGYLSVTVESDCTDPATSLRFSNVPASGERTGTIVCPPGTTDPNVSVVSWVRA